MGLSSSLTHSPTIASLWTNYSEVELKLAITYHPEPDPMCTLNYRLLSAVALPPQTHELSVLD